MGVGTYSSFSWGVGLGWVGCLFEAGCLLTFTALRMGVLIQGGC